MKIILQLAFLLSTFYFLHTTAKPIIAQSASLSITPPVVEILLSPNKKIIQAFTIKNQAESGQFIANLHLVTPIDSEGHVSVDPTPLEPSSIPLLLALQNADLSLNTPFSLLAGDSQQLVLSIAGTNTDIPLDTYFALVVSPVSPSYSSSTSTIPGLSALLLVTLTPDGNLPINLELENFDPPVIHDNLTPLTLTPALHNLASTMIRTEGKLEIISPTGQKVIALPLYPHLTLGDSSRLLQGTTPCELQGTKPCSPIPLEWSPSLLNLGPYRLRLSVTTLGGTTVQEIERTVWLFPFRALLIFSLFVLFLLSVFLYRRRRPTSSQETSP